MLALYILAFYLDDPSTDAALLKLGTWSPLLGVLGILLVQALVSFAVVRYFWAPAATTRTGSRRSSRRSPGGC